MKFGAVSISVLCASSLVNAQRDGVLKRKKPEYLRNADADASTNGVRKLFYGAETRLAENFVPIQISMSVEQGAVVGYDDDGMSSPSLPLLVKAVVVAVSMMVIIWMIFHSSSSLSLSISKPTKHSSTATSWAKTSTSTAASLEAKFNSSSTNYQLKNNKPYKLVERQVVNTFFDHYMFYNGADSIGSGGYQIYVSQDKAKELGIYNITKEEMIVNVTIFDDVDDNGKSMMSPKIQQQEYVIMKSTPITTT